MLLGTRFKIRNFITKTWSPWAKLRHFIGPVSSRCPISQRLISQKSIFAQLRRTIIRQDSSCPEYWYHLVHIWGATSDIEYQMRWPVQIDVHMITQCMAPLSLAQQHVHHTDYTCLHLIARYDIMLTAAYEKPEYGGLVMWQRVDWTRGNARR
jgi:hypothetical protein